MALLTDFKMHDVSRKKLTDMDIGIADGMQRVNNVW
jgi:hypothetical protein